jgi:predicted component of type VI protein secretion system
MAVSLKILHGARTGATFAIPEGGVVRFGRTNQSDCALPEDTFLSGQHFAVGSSKGRIMVSDLGSTNGTLVNGFKIRQAQLKDKDRITAGHTTFLVQIEEESKAPAPVAASAAAVATDEKAPFRAPLSPVETALVEYLGKQQEPVYAVMDAARDAFVLPVIQAFAEEYRSLYQGASAENLADCAPYLVRVKRDTRIIEELSHGWG